MVSFWAEMRVFAIKALLGENLQILLILKNLCKMLCLC